MIELINFNKIERRGLLSLLSIVIAIQCYEMFLILKPRDSNSSINIMPLMQADSSIQEHIKSSDIKSLTAMQANDIDSLPMISLDNLTVEHLTAYGLPDRLINNWINFRAKGAKFYSVEDLKKIYGMEQADLNKIKDKVNYDKRISKNSTKKVKSHIQIEPQIKNYRPELNSAEANALYEIEGIDKRLAYRIIKYRDMIGGYHNLNQLSKVYDITEEALSILTKHCDLDTTRIVKLNPYTMSVDSFASHYIVSQKNAQLIKAYLEIKSNEQVSKAELFKIPGIWKASLQQSLPYLELHQDSSRTGL